MKILIVGLTKNYQFKRLKEEGKKRGHIVDGVKTDDLTIYSDKNTFDPKIVDRDISSYDLIYSFATKRRWEWYLTFIYLNRKYSTKIINRRIVSRDSGVFLAPISLVDYYRQTQNKIDYPASVTFYSQKAMDTILVRLNFPIIVKSSVGKQGRLVFKVEDKKDLMAKIGILENEKDAIVAREFIPNEGDLRIFVVGYKAVAAMKRIPKEGDFRSNISQGGRGEKFDFTKHAQIKKLAEIEAKTTGTEIAGVDVIINKDTGKPYILEVNANPQFEGLEKYTGVNVAQKIIEYFETIA